MKRKKNHLKYMMWSIVKMYVKIDKLNENHGWSIRVDQEVLGCNDCNKPLSKRYPR